MKELELNGVTYQIVNSVGELPARRGLAIYSTIQKLSSGLLTEEDFNVQYIALVLGTTPEFVETLNFETFMKALTFINENFKILTDNEKSE